MDYETHTEFYGPYGKQSQSKYSGFWEDGRMKSQVSRTVRCVYFKFHEPASSSALSAAEGTEEMENIHGGPPPDRCQAPEIPAPKMKKCGEKSKKI